MIIAKNGALYITVHTAVSISVRKLKRRMQSRAQSSNAIMEPQLDIPEKERNYKIGEEVHLEQDLGNGTEIKHKAN